MLAPEQAEDVDVEAETQAAVSSGREGASLKVSFVVPGNGEEDDDEDEDEDAEGEEEIDVSGAGADTMYYGW